MKGWTVFSLCSFRDVLSCFSGQWLKRKLYPLSTYGSNDGTQVNVSRLLKSIHNLLNYFIQGEKGIKLVIRIHPLGTTTVCTKSYVHPSDGCWGISVVERLTKPMPPSNAPTAGMAEHLYYTTEHLVQLNIYVIPQIQLPLVLIFWQLDFKRQRESNLLWAYWMWDMCRADGADQRWLLIAWKKTSKKRQIDLRWLDFYSWLNWKQMWWRASVAYNGLLELIYLACGANAEQLFCSCCSGSDVCHTELLRKDTGFRSACGLLWLNAQQTFCYVRSALMMRMFSRHELVFPAFFSVYCAW